MRVELVGARGFEPRGSTTPPLVPDLIAEACVRSLETKGLASGPRTLDYPIELASSRAAVEMRDRSAAFSLAVSQAASTPASAMATIASKP